jgi:ABC-type multidrug transport system fused ATPase/permease subunit
VTILGIYILLALAVVFFIAYIGPVLTKQVTSLANTSVQTWEKMTENSESMLFHFFQTHFDYDIRQGLFSFAQQATTILSKNLLEFIAFATRLATILAVIPFIVFYLLKDDHNFASTLLRGVPEDFAFEVRKILRNMDATLANYITGLILVSSSVGTLLFIGYDYWIELCLDFVLAGHYFYDHSFSRSFFIYHTCSICGFSNRLLDGSKSVDRIYYCAADRSEFHFSSNYWATSAYSPFDHYSPFISGRLSLWIRGTSFSDPSLCSCKSAD